MIDHRGRVEFRLFVKSDELSGQVNYEVESKTKSAKSKKLKFFSTISLFSKLTNWSVNDDQLVDLLHTNYFPVTKEQVLKTFIFF